MFLKRRLPRLSKKKKEKKFLKKKEDTSFVKKKPDFFFIKNFLYNNFQRTNCLFLRKKL